MCLFFTDLTTTTSSSDEGSEVEGRCLREAEDVCDAEVSPAACAFGFPGGNTAHFLAAALAEVCAALVAFPDDVEPGMEK